MVLDVANNLSLYIKTERPFEMVRSIVTVKRQYAIRRPKGNGSLRNLHDIPCPTLLSPRRIVSLKDDYVRSHKYLV